MRIAIVGGALQGMEAVYLSKLAGYETLVIDRKAHAPALALADEAAIMDPTEDMAAAMKLFADCDAVLPACEELDLWNSFTIISSERKSLYFRYQILQYILFKNQIQHTDEHGRVPMPEPWPKCGYPVIVKPSSQSGSIGVTPARNDMELNEGLLRVAKLNDSPVIQEFVHGKSISIEAIGNGKKARSYVTTEVVLDRNYDCKMVRCNPEIIPDEDEELFRKACRNTAELMGLSALMDMEAIYTEKGIRVLEIDARIPSQTPAAVEAGSGINLLKELVDCSMGKTSTAKDSRKAGIYEHYVFRDGALATSGEKEFGKVRNPTICTGLFGSDRMITDYESGKKEWHATVITYGRDAADAEKKHLAVRDRMIAESGASVFDDGSPEMV